MTYEWEKYTKFVDDIGTVFEKIDSPNHDYRFVTAEGDTDFCSKEQMIDWDIKFTEAID